MQAFICFLPRTAKRGPAVLAEVDPDRYGIRIDGAPHRAIA
jgi:hypothetical protein